jgi:hypothetical protein
MCREQRLQRVLCGARSSATALGTVCQLASARVFAGLIRACVQSRVRSFGIGAAGILRLSAYVGAQSETAAALCAAQCHSICVYDAWRGLGLAAPLRCMPSHVACDRTAPARRHAEAHAHSTLKPCDGIPHTAAALRASPRALSQLHVNARACPRRDWSRSAALPHDAQLATLALKHPNLVLVGDSGVGGGGGRGAADAARTGAPSLGAQPHVPPSMCALVAAQHC